MKSMQNILIEKSTYFWILFLYDFIRRKMRAFDFLGKESNQSSLLIHAGDYLFRFGLLNIFSPSPPTNTNTMLYE